MMAAVQALKLKSDTRAVTAAQPTGLCSVLVDHHVTCVGLTVDNTLKNLYRPPNDIVLLSQYSSTDFSNIMTWLSDILEDNSLQSLERPLLDTV